MTPEQLAHDTRDAIVRVTGGFMTDPACYACGAALGFEGMDFYVAGRAGALGDVPADVVVATLVFFSPDAIRPAWERSAPVMPRRSAAEHFATWAHTWAEEHLPDGVDYARLATLLGAIVASASVAGVPLFAAWRTLPEPSAPKALTIHRMNAIRELRGGLHGAAVLTIGLTPVEAISVRTAAMLPVFGWTDEPADPKPLHERWNLAEARTDRMLGRRLAVLDDAERTELDELLRALAP